MSHPPWTVEEPVDAERAATLIERHFGLSGEVTLLGEGWDSAAFRLGDAVFRFPKRAVIVPHLQTELAVLPLLAGLPLPIPQPRWVALPDADYPFPFAGYPFLPGVPLDQLEEEDGDADRVLDQLLPFLDALHALPAEGPLAHAHGWPPAEPNDIEHPVAERARAWLAAHPRPAVAPVLLHADLGLDHVLVDPDTGRVTGIVDWGDLDRGDRARDLAGLIRWQPERLAARRSREDMLRAWSFAVLSGLEGCAVTARWLPDEAEEAWQDLAWRLDEAERFLRT